MDELLEAIVRDIGKAYKGIVRRLVFSTPDGARMIVTVYRADKADEGAESAIQTAKEVREGTLDDGRDQL